jgi:hypothetical protein
MSRKSRQCGILNISQPYRPRWAVKAIALLSFMCKYTKIELQEIRLLFIYIVAQNVLTYPSNILGSRQKSTGFLIMPFFAKFSPFCLHTFIVVLLLFLKGLMHTKLEELTHWS